jgi:hypothetical protein
MFFLFLFVFLLCKISMSIEKMAHRQGKKNYASARWVAPLSGQARFWCPQPDPTEPIRTPKWIGPLEMLSQDRWMERRTK